MPELLDGRLFNTQLLSSFYHGTYLSWRRRQHFGECWLDLYGIEWWRGRPVSFS
jgi:hypothetical protein